MRVNIYDTPDYPDERPALVGWYDPNQCEHWDSETEWDGNNNTPLVTGSHTEWERLFRTPGGRWVVYHWSRWEGHPDRHSFVSPEDAREWMIRAGLDSAEIERATGQAVEPERGPGQPRIGQQIKATLPDDQVAALTGMVERGEAASLADAVRQTIARGLTA